MTCSVSVRELDLQDRLKQGQPIGRQKFSEDNSARRLRQWYSHEHNDLTWSARRSSYGSLKRVWDLGSGNGRTLYFYWWTRRAWREASQKEAASSSQSPLTNGTYIIESIFPIRKSSISSTGLCIPALKKRFLKSTLEKLPTNTRSPWKCH